jgi:hypothetical protein
VDREQTPAILSDLAEEAAAAEDSLEVEVVRPRDGEELLAFLEGDRKEMVVVDALDFRRVDWSLLDRRRSSLSRRGLTVFVTTPAGFDEMMQSAANLSSWIGLVFAHPRDPEAAAFRQQRLASLRQWSGRSDDDVVRTAEEGRIPADPEFAEWLVLLGRGDLLPTGS